MASAREELDALVDQCIDEINGGDAALSVVLMEIVDKVRTIEQMVNALGVVTATVHQEKLRSIILGDAPTETRQDEEGSHGLYL